MRRPAVRTWTVLAALVAALLAAAWSAGTPLTEQAGTGTPGSSAGSEAPQGQPSTQRAPAAPTPGSLPAVEVAALEGATVIPGSDPATLALATSRALFAAAPAAVVLGDGTGPSSAAETAATLGVPALTGPADEVAGELDRLGVTAVVTVGEVGPDSTGDRTRVEGADPAAAAEALGEALGGDWEAARPDPVGAVVLTPAGDPAPATLAAGSARAAGATVVPVVDADPRTTPAAIAAIAAAGRPPAVLALGDAFGPPELLAQRVRTAATGVELPGGGQVPFPHRRMVALYGHPGTGSLGVLGEQGIEAAVERARTVAADYEPLSDVPVVPAFEIIATVASAEPGADGDYSNESDPETLRPWVEAAGDAGVYVLLDLQPGRSDFLGQARRYESLLRLPHVGLALDPEWRLAPGERHLEQIGSVGADEVNAVAGWLDGLVLAEALPAKVLVLHQFRHSMLRDRGRIRTDWEGLDVVVHADGNGVPEEKLATWRSLRDRPDARRFFWAWKNFYDEDRPTFTPAQTMALDPSPVLVSYQ